MAWFSGNISLGNIADLAGGAVNKLQESVKSIEKNFDTALGFEEKDKAESSNEASGLWTSSTDRKALFNPVMAFMGQNNEEEDVDSSQNPDSQTSSEFIRKSEEDESPQHLSISEDKRAESDEPADSATEKTVAEEESRVVASETDEEHPVMEDGEDAGKLKVKDVENEMPLVHVEHSEAIVKNFESSASIESSDEKEIPEIGGLRGSEQVQENLRPIDNEHGTSNAPDQSDNVISVPENVHEQIADPESKIEEKMQDEESVEMVSTIQPEGLSDAKTGDTAEPSVLHSVAAEVASDSDGRSADSDLHVAHRKDESTNAVPEDVIEENNTNIKEGDAEEPVVKTQEDISEQDLGSETHKSGSPDSVHELEKLKKEMQMMENALQGAARQAQAKADDIAKLMNENEQLKAVVEELKRKPSDAEIETLREEYHQRVATLERKVYALTKERDTLRREQNKKSDAAHLLKEKDEIINQVMAEGNDTRTKLADI